jgi:hypothetical protein
MAEFPAFHAIISLIQQLEYCNHVNLLVMEVTLAAFNIKLD